MQVLAGSRGQAVLPATLESGDSQLPCMLPQGKEQLGWGTSPRSPQIREHGGQPRTKPAQTRRIQQALPQWHSSVLHSQVVGEALPSGNPRPLYLDSYSRQA